MLPYDKMQFAWLPLSNYILRAFEQHIERTLGKLSTECLTQVST